MKVKVMRENNGMKKDLEVWWKVEFYHWVIEKIGKKLVIEYNLSCLICMWARESTAFLPVSYFKRYEYNLPS